jgi:hypothetical protein
MQLEIGEQQEYVNTSLAQIAADRRQLTEDRLQLAQERLLLATEQRVQEERHTQMLRDQNASQRTLIANMQRFIVTQQQTRRQLLQKRKSKLWFHLNLHKAVA